MSSLRTRISHRPIPLPPQSQILTQSYRIVSIGLLCYENLQVWKSGPTSHAFVALPFSDRICRGGILTGKGRSNCVTLGLKAQTNQAWEGSKIPRWPTIPASRFYIAIKLTTFTNCSSFTSAIANTTKSHYLLENSSLGVIFCPIEDSRHHESRRKI